MTKWIFRLMCAAVLCMAVPAGADVLDFPDGGTFRSYTASGTYAACVKDTATFAAPTDGAPFVTRTCVANATAASCQALVAAFLWPPTASTSAGTCTCEVEALNNVNGTTTQFWSLAVGCCVGGTADCTSKTFGTEQTLTLTNVAATINTALIKASNGTGAAPNAYTNLAAGVPCEFRLVHKSGGTEASSPYVLTHVKAMHCSCT